MDSTDAEALRGWLQAVGAGEVFDPLHAADVDLDVVLELTEDDLRELGLTLGQRKRLLKAIESLRESGPPSPEAQSNRAERRQLSFLFCDLVGSTAISTRFDAEALAELQQTYHATCAQVAESWGGRLLAQYGDGCLAVFGHPVVHEDDAERAVRAGLDMVEAVAEAGPFDGERLQCRVAIATGRVVIGDLTGSADPNAVAGETPNLAARLQDLAEAGGVVIAPSTQRLVRHAFDLESLGAHDLKGFPDPVEAWAVRGSVDTHDQGGRLPNNQSLIGREAEMAALHDAWTQSMTGQARVVLVSAEAGLGKSWLVDAFARRALSEVPKARRLRFFCTELKTNVALSPILAEIARQAGIKGIDTPAQVRARLTDLAETSTLLKEDSVQLLAAQFGADDPDHPLPLNAAQQKVAMFRLLLERLMVTEDAPLLVEFEDAHWADPTSLELLNQIASAPPARPVMVIVTARREFDPGWAPNPFLSHLTLDRLDLHQSLALAQDAVGANTLPDARLRDIVAKADGVPLFISELTRAVAELETSNVGGTLQVPDTLEDSLMARLDRLGTAKGIAQIAATLGRRFRVSTLAAVSDMSHDELDEALDRLVRSDIIFRDHRAQVETYVFRHALIQDAAYESVLRSDRKVMHARIAEILSTEKHEAAITEPEILARHFAGAEMVMEAVGNLIEAGRNATSRAAQIEANNHFRAALELLQTAADAEATNQLEAMVHALLGQSLLATVGFGAPEVGEAFERARELAAEANDMGLLAGCLYGVATFAAARGERDKAKTLSDEGLTIFGESPIPIFALGTHFMDGVTKLYQCDMAGADAAFERALGHYDPKMQGMVVQVYGDDLGAFAMIYLYWSAILQGDFVKAQKYQRDHRELVETSGDKSLETRELGFVMTAAHLVGDVEQTTALADMLIEQATQLCYPHWASVGKNGRGWADVFRGDVDAGLTLQRECLGFFDLIGQKTPLSSLHSTHISALVEAGRMDEALAMSDLAIETAQTNLDALYLPELKRLKGLALQSRDAAGAEACLREAIEDATRHGMYFFALRAAMALCALRPDDDTARGLLAAARDRISAPKPMALLNEADAMLAAPVS